MESYKEQTELANARTAEQTNALVWQKDNLWMMLREAKHSESFQIVVGTLQLLAPLWSTLGYKYKTQEIASSTVNDMTVELESAKAGRDQLRKNTAAWLVLDGEIKQLESLITEANLLRE